MIATDANLERAQPSLRPGGRLHIAMIAPPWQDVPPRAYGGIEEMLASLVNGLDRRGHQVTLIGAGRTTAPARFLSTYSRPPSERIGDPLPELLHAARARRLLAGLDADIVHDHSLAGPLTAACRAVPTVVTCHGPADGELGACYRELGADISLVAISDAQRRNAPGLDWVATVHNALDVDTYPFRPDKEEWVLWLGRFHPYKGAHLAIDAARAAGRNIILAGKLTEPTEHACFDTYIRPRLGPDATYIGEADAGRKRELLAAARCLLFPIHWEEPFGMVLIEAMACGTPVVALGRGAVPEVVADGRTGFVLHSAAQLPEAIQAIERIDPHACRKHVEQYFSAETMAAAYEQVYWRVLRSRSARRPASTRVDLP
ncbi:glycosyltransferase involved in cell wall biosynthesis [Nonomuraea polychroma]|uniref:Glycosyltransferase involved in cell wall biosynthesis n=1 Tax=Nonomuraea polychroma TaxID=46176 RepID=A0A438M789_9ACTN|nr:glycosyltransferase family 4 protein [Nonomuraea polychroma]RVX41591.1 glycosyltransferase involved in cell wall biosynthesis [Nonomuraea polychroma]